MTAPTPRLTGGAYVAAGIVLAVGAAFPLAADAIRPGPISASWEAVARSAGWAAGPAAALGWAARWGRGHRLAAWASFVGALFTLGLGVALYAASLRPDSRSFAPAVAVTFVPVRQLATSAFVGWAVWLARRAR